VDVRVIAATNKNLEAAVAAGEFRPDLYYRLKVIWVRMPSLREQAEDIPLLAGHYLARFSEEFNKPIKKLSTEAAKMLQQYAWPGNVRELRNVIERAVALTRFDTLTVEDLPEKIRDYRSSQVILASNDPGELVPLEEVERRYILHVLDAVGGNRTLAARTLGLDRKTLYRKLRQYGVLVADGDGIQP
jgi:two-component system response regulator HydG